MDRPNIVIVMADTLRTAYMGCYGNPTIHTPHLDAFARQSVRFTRAYPESLPTIPVRRALHTGRRAFPFRNYRPLKWGTVYLPGWQPLADEEDTLAETLAEAGYQTGFGCTTQHCWNPGYNFERGFWQWEYARGYSGEDRWGSPFGVPRHMLARYGDPDTLMQRPHAGNSGPMVLANRGVAMADEQTATARLFRWGAQFVEHNRERPFYLLLDSFAPHEPWQAPEEYYRLYANPNYRGITHLSARYGPADGYAPEEIEDIKAQYSGLVTHLDHWFGVFLERLDALGLGENTAVLFLSDHGTNFTDNPRNVIGKPANAMYPGVMHLPLLVRLPAGQAAGTDRAEFVYNLDVVATAYDLAGLRSEQGVDGQSLLPLLTGQGAWHLREYVTCRYTNSLCYMDDTHWVLTDIDGQPQDIFDLQADPLCTHNIVDSADPAIFRRAWERLLADAGGTFPDYRGMQWTDALGRVIGGTRLA